MIKVSHLHKAITGVPILNDISFSIDKGEIVGFLGPNGAGKTTTMRIITGYLPPSSGSVTVSGYNVSEDSIHARQHIGYLPEHVPLYLDLTVDEYLSFFARIMGVKKKLMKDEISSVKDKTGLTHVSQKIIGSLSRGYRQRVGLAQSLLGSPELLILDEPTVGLDPVQIIEIRELIKNLAKHQTVILSTHILPEVSQICNRVLIINKGSIVADGKPEELTKTNKSNNKLILTLGKEDPKAVQLIKNIGGVTRVDGLRHGEEYSITLESNKDIRHDLLKKLIDGNVDIREFKSEKIDLESVFLSLVTEEKKDIPAKDPDVKK